MSLGWVDRPWRPLPPVAWQLFKRGSVRLVEKPKLGEELAADRLRRLEARINTIEVYLAAMDRLVRR